MITGTITGFSSTWGSGLATLSVDHNPYHCDSGPLVRALDQMFPGFITPGHTCDPSHIIGQQVTIHLDELGLCIGSLEAA